MPRYHLRRQDRAIAAAEELRAILRAGKYLTVGLCRENEPYLVTLSYGYDAERNVLYFHCATEGQKLDFIRANAQVCAQVIHDRGYLAGDCDHDYRSVVVRGRMAIVEDLAEKHRAIDVLLSHLEPEPDVIRSRQPIGDAAFASTVILRLDVEEMTGKEHRTKT